MINVSIDIKCADPEEAKALLEDIASGIQNDEFCAACDKKMQERYGGTIFVTEYNH